MANLNSSNFTHHFKGKFVIKGPNINSNIGFLLARRLQFIIDEQSLYKNYFGIKRLYNVTHNGSINQSYGYVNTDIPGVYQYIVEKLTFGVKNHQFDSL